MKLLFLGDAQSIHFARWVRFFAAKGYRVFAWSAEPPKEELPGYRRFFPRLPGRFFKYLSFVPELKKEIAQLGPDLINAHFVPNYGFAATLAGRRPLVITTWGSDVLLSPKKSFLHRWRVIWALARGDLVTADSQSAADAIIKLGVNKEKILVVPMGVERAFFREVEGKLPGRREHLAVLSCRRLEKLYNVETLLRALSRLGERPNWRALIVGRGAERGKLELLAARSGIANRVSFLGELAASDYRRVLLESDIYVSTALSDSTSVSLLEAMASKLACVVTDIPGNREWVEPMQTGLTYAPRDDAVLARLVGQLMDDPDLRLGLGKRAFEKVARAAVWEDNMADVEEAFLKVARACR